MGQDCEQTCLFLYTHMDECLAFTGLHVRFLHAVWTMIFHLDTIYRWPTVKPNKYMTMNKLLKLGLQQADIPYLLITAACHQYVLQLVIAELGDWSLFCSRNQRCVCVGELLVRDGCTKANLLLIHRIPHVRCLYQCCQFHHEMLCCPGILHDVRRRHLLCLWAWSGFLRSRTR